MKITIAMLVLWILAAATLIAAVILQEIRLRRVEKRTGKLAKGFVTMEESFLNLHKEQAGLEAGMEELGTSLEGLKRGLEELGETAREAMEAQRDADKAWAEGVQEIMKFSVGK